MKTINDEFVRYLDLDDDGVRTALALWRQRAARNRANATGHAVVHEFQSCEVKRAVVKLFEAQIRELRLAYLHQVAAHETAMAFQGLRLALLRHDGITVDADDGQRIVPEVLAVIRTDAKEDRPEGR